MLRAAWLAQDVQCESGWLAGSCRQAGSCIACGSIPYMAALNFSILRSHVLPCKQHFELQCVFAVQAIEPLFSMQAAFDTNGGAFVNNEFIDVYLVTVKDEIPVNAFTLQQSEVAAVR